MSRAEIDPYYPDQVGIGELSKMVSLDPVTISRLIESGRFPPSFKPASTRRWLIAHIEAWKQGHINGKPLAYPAYPKQHRAA